MPKIGCQDKTSDHPLVPYGKMVVVDVAGAEAAIQPRLATIEVSR